MSEDIASTADIETESVLRHIAEFQATGRSVSIGSQSGRLTLARFLSTCHGIEVDLRNLALECRRRSQSIKALVERASLRVNDYTDRREFAFRSKGDAGALIIQGTTSSSGSDGTLNVMFPTWDVLAVLWGITHEMTTGSSLAQLQKSLLLGLSALQRIVGLWQQQQSYLRGRQRWPDAAEERERSRNSFDDDVFFTGEQLDVVLRLFTEHAEAALCLEALKGAAAATTVGAPRASASNGKQSGGSVLPPQPVTPETESIQLKILQTILALFSTDTPLFSRTTLVVEGRSGESAASSTGGEDTTTAWSALLPAVTAAKARVSKILHLLISMHCGSPFAVVRRTALAGLSQFSRFLLDSSTVLVCSACGGAPAGTPIKINPDDAILLYVTYSIMTNLCDLALGYTTFFGDAAFEMPLALDLLVASIGTCPGIFSVYPPMQQLLDKLEPMMTKTIADPKTPLSLLLRTLSLFQCYWTHVDMTTPSSSLDSVLALIDSGQAPWRLYLGLQCFRWLLFQKRTPTPVLVSLVECLGKAVHEICFSIEKTLLVDYGAHALRHWPPFHLSQQQCSSLCPTPLHIATDATPFSAIVVREYAPLNILTTSLSTLSAHGHVAWGNLLLTDAFASECSNRKGTEDPQTRALNQHQEPPTTITMSAVLRLALDLIMQILEGLVRELFLSFPNFIGLIQDAQAGVSVDAMLTNLCLPPLFLRPCGSLVYVPLPRPLTQRQAELQVLVADIWAPAVSALSLALHLASVSSSAAECALQGLLSLTTVSAVLSVNKSTAACIRTVVQATAVLMPHMSSGACSSFASDTGLTSTSTAAPSSGLWKQKSVQKTTDSTATKLSMIQLTSIKALLCVARHLGPTLDEEAWSILLKAYESLHKLLLSRSLICPSASEGLEWPFTRALDDALEAGLGGGTTTTTTSHDDVKTTSPLITPAATPGQSSSSSSSDLLFLEAVLASVFERSHLVLITEASMLLCLKQLIALLTRQRPNDFQQTATRVSGDNAPSLVSTLCFIGALSSENILVEKKEAANAKQRVEITLAEPPMDANIPKALEVVSCYALEQFHHVVLKSVPRMTSVSTIATVAELLGSVARDDTLAPGIRAEATTVMCRFCWNVIETVGQNRSSFSEKERALSQALVLGHLVDILNMHIPSEAKHQILEMLYGMLRASGSRLCHTLPWSIVVILIGVYAKLTLGSDALKHRLDMSFRSSNSGPSRFHTDQAVPLFDIIDVIVHEFPDRLQHASCFSLLSSVLSALVKSHAVDNNLSFTSVGLLWTLAESLTRKRHHTADQQNASDGHVPQGRLVAGDWVPWDAVVRLEGCGEVAVSLVEPEALCGDVDTMIIKVFEEFRALATDSRVEVRNCSLRSLSSAYLTITDQQDGLKDRVGLILVGALQDISAMYQCLLEGKEPEQHRIVQEGLQHHSRDSLIKLWDESVTIILEGVLEVIADDTAAAKDDDQALTDQRRVNCHGRGDDIKTSVLIKAGQSLAQMLKILLQDGLPEGTGNSATKVSLDVSLVALRVLSKVILLPLSNSLVVEQPDVTLSTAGWEILRLVADALWRSPRIADRVAEALTAVISALGPTVLTRYDSRKAKAFSILVQLLLMLGTMDNRLTPTEVLPLSPHVSSLSNEQHQLPVLDPPKTGYQQHAPQDQRLRLNENANLDESIEQLKPTLLHGIADDLAFCTVLDFLDLPDAPELLHYPWSERTERCCRLCAVQGDTTDCNATAFELFSRSEAFQHRAGEDAAMTTTTTTTTTATPTFLSVLAANALRGATTRYRSSPPIGFDDDYISEPAWLGKGGVNTGQDRSRSSSSDPWSSDANRLKTFSTTDTADVIHSMRLQRLQVPSRRLHSNDVAVLEALEGFLPWESLLLHNPSLWLKLLVQILRALLDPSRVYCHVSCVLLAARAINALLRIFRLSLLRVRACVSHMLLHIIGSGFYCISGRLLLLLTTRPDLGFLGFSLFVSEATLQFLADTRVLLSFAEPLKRHSLLVLYASTSVILDAFQRSWEVGTAKTVFHHHTASKRTPESLDWLVLYTTRILLGLETPRHTTQLLPRCLFSSIIGLLNRFIVIGNRHGMLELSRASLETVFDVCDVLSQTTVAPPELYDVTTVMVELVRALLGRFIDDDLQSGQCPLPRQRLEEVGFVLQRLRSLRLPCPPPPPPRPQPTVPQRRDLVAQLTGHRSHIVRLLPDLLKLIVAKDGHVRMELKNVLEEGLAGLCSDEPLHDTTSTA